MSSSSFGQSTSSSSSTPTVIRTPENDLLDQIAQYAQQLAGQYANWANGVYQQTSAVTDQAVNNFFQTSQRMSDFAQGLTDQYNNLFAPENAQLIQDANTYASEPRLRANMGMAGATQAQAGDAAIRNSEQQLLSYGIDPSAGRYRGLDEAARVQNAANVAGAENLQRNADIQTGQNLRSQAVQVGSLLPSAVTNASNTAIQANTGASNAALANANTGVNLMSLANRYLQTAMGLKLPPVGQNTRSSGQSSNNSQSSDPSRGGAGAGGAGGGYGGYGGGGGPAWMPQHGGGGGAGGSGRYVGAGGAGARIMNLSQPDAGTWDTGWQPNDLYNDPNGWGGADFSQWTNPSYDSSYGGYDASANYDPYSGDYAQYDYGNYNQGYGGLPDMSYDTSGLGNFTYDPSANNYDPGWGSYYDQPSADTSWGDPSGGFSGYQDFSGGGGDFGYSNYGVDDSYGSYDDYGFAYAGGGEVPVSASPSGGAQVDDVPAQLASGAPARLNANEFVVPQDVANWKGQEFFHKLIAQSRANAAKMRGMSGATPKPMAR